MLEELRAELYESKGKIQIMLACIVHLDRLIHEGISLNDRRAKDDLNRLKKRLDADVEALKEALADAVANDVNLPAVVKRLTETIEQELLFYPASPRLRLPDKIEEAKALVGRYADPASFAEVIKLKIDTYTDHIPLWKTDLIRKYSKDLTVVSLDIVGSTALPKTAKDKAKSLARNIVEDYQGRPNPIMIAEQGDDEFYAVFDDPLKALKASVSIQRAGLEIAEQQLGKKVNVAFRIGIDWDTGIVERRGHCPSETTSKITAKRLRDINSEYRKGGLIYCTSGFINKLPSITKRTCNGLDNSRFHRHTGLFSGKKHEAPFSEVWEVLWSDDQKPHRPPQIEIKAGRSSLRVGRPSSLRSSVRSIRGA